MRIPANAPVPAMLLVFVSAVAASDGSGPISRTQRSTPAIRNIGAFISECPDRDPNFTAIMRDFEIRRDRQPTSAPPCTEPLSAIPLAQLSDELIVQQGLRAMYYMDRGQSGHLPWTEGTLYEWMKTKIAGVNIVTGMAGGSCCALIDGRRFINVGAQNDFNRDFDRSWRGLSGNISLYAHEARHVDGYPHSSCCGLKNGCSDNFDVTNLDAFGVQWWLNKLWLDGTINVGYQCGAPEIARQTTDWLTDSLTVTTSRYCAVKPPAVSPPTIAGGNCTLRRRPVRR